MIKIKEEWKINENLYECPFCARQYSKSGIGTHIWRKHTIEGKRHKPDTNIGYKLGIRKATNHFIKAKQKGINLKVSKNFRLKMSKIRTGKKLSQSHKKSISKGMKRAVIEGRHKVIKPGGIGCNVFKFKNLEGIQFHIQGTWELKFVEFLNDKKIKWQRNFKSFEYLYENKNHKYFPDFYLIDYDIYKGRTIVTFTYDAMFFYYKVYNTKLHKALKQ